jgi:NAD(P)-dependent dehydrogenase (short-subunit alcohol dehydrogenase family)
MKHLEGKIAIIAGGSRGAGRGIALALGEAGATVYVAARTSRSGPPNAVPGTVEDTAEQVTARGGTGIPVRADLSKEEEVAALFARVENDHGRLDLVANSAWGANFMPVWSKRFWELSPAIWQETLDTVSVCWLTSRHAARIMQKQRHGLIIHVTDNLPTGVSDYRGQILHDLGHECLNRLIWAMAREAKKANVAVIGLNPGFMRTEAVLQYMTTEERRRQFRFDLSESPEYIGRAVAALAGDNQVIGKTGQLLWVADLASGYGFTDIDGRYIPKFDPTAPLQAYPC